MILECLSREAGLEAITQVHKELCGEHQLGVKMRWLLQRHDLYWPKILKNGLEYAKGCQQCQRHGPFKHMPTVDL